MKVKPTEGSYRKAAVFIDTKPTTRNTKFTKNALSEVSSFINNKSLPLMLSHDSSKLPTGRWYEAKVNENDQVIAKFFIPQEIPEHNDIKTRIDTGILDSVSIGFSAGKHDCSICGNDIYDYENCQHIPGKEYDGETCYVMLEGIRPSEGSLVYSGAVPDAKIKSGDASEYSDCTDKKQFCERFSFKEGELEIVQAGKIMQDSLQNQNEGKSMELQDKFNSLQDNYTDLASKYADLNKVKLDLEAEKKDYEQKLAEYKADNDKLMADVESYKAKVEEANSLVAFFKENVEKLAQPFEANYKAPEDLSKLKEDFNTYMEKLRALPVGRQSTTGEASVAFELDDNIFRSN